MIHNVSFKHSGLNTDDMFLLPYLCFHRYSPHRQGLHFLLRSEIFLLHDPDMKNTKRNKALILKTVVSVARQNTLLQCGFIRFVGNPS